MAEENIYFQDKRATRNQQEWWTTPDGKIGLSWALGRTLLHQLHQTTHLGQTKMLQQRKEPQRRLPHDAQLVHKLIPKKIKKKKKIKEPRERERGTYSVDHWEVDFTEVTPTVGGYKYLFVFMETFSR
uniref:Integrase catalytic domain-containing protein n=1 Tax=Rousettus aegyptiacus TaxID=9407 RepID=A0A7J8C2D4_ROUAE|nr:hypothetical protein HJG63_009353 [Rousettus aegyptiacus]